MGESVDKKNIKDFERVAAPSVVPYFAVGIFCIIYALIFPLYLFWHFLIPAALAVGLFFVLKKLCKPRYITVEVQKAPPTAEELWQETALGYLEKLRAADEAIEDEEVSKSIRGIENLTAEIFRAVTDKKEKRPQVRRFMEYYLPTLLKLLSVYDKMEESGGKGENVRTTREKINSLLYTANCAFAKLADDLYEQESIDVSSDITVFNNLLKQEGLSGDNNE